MGKERKVTDGCVCPVHLCLGKEKGKREKKKKKRGEYGEDWLELKCTTITTTTTSMRTRQETRPILR